MPRFKHFSYDQDVIVVINYLRDRDKVCEVYRELKGQ